MMKCQKCGSNMNDGICPDCGNRSETWIEVLEYTKEWSKSIGERGRRDIIRCHTTEEETDESVYDRNWKSDKFKELWELV